MLAREVFQNRNVLFCSTPVKNAVGGFKDGAKIVITEGNHRVVAATMYGMKTGNFSILEKLIQHGNINPTPLTGYQISKFPMIWR